MLSADNGARRRGAAVARLATYRALIGSDGWPWSATGGVLGEVEWRAGRSQ